MSRLPPHQDLRTIDPNSHASDPGGIAVSNEKLRRLRPDLFGFGAVMDIVLTLSSIRQFPHRRMILEQLRSGDSRAAVVLKTEPSLIVAAYTDELDCVAVLQFDAAFAADYGLKPGAKLLTVNTYRPGPKYAADLTPGPGDLGNWKSFSPMIADFLTDDIDRLKARKAQIDAAEWKRTAQLGMACLDAHPNRFRDGRPVYAEKPAR